MENVQWVYLRNSIAPVLILMCTSTASADVYTIQTGTTIETHASSYSSTGGEKAESGYIVTTPSHSSSVIQVVLQNGHSTGTVDVHKEETKNGVTRVEDRREFLVNESGFAPVPVTNTEIHKNSVRVSGPRKSSVSVQSEAQPQIHTISSTTIIQIGTSSPITLKKHLNEGVLIKFTHSLLSFLRFLFSIQ